MVSTLCVILAKHALESASAEVLSFPHDRLFYSHILLNPSTILKFYCFWFYCVVNCQTEMPLNVDRLQFEMVALQKVAPMTNCLNNNTGFLIYTLLLNFASI